jgi:hypothetical protein
MMTQPSVAKIDLTSTKYECLAGVSLADIIHGKRSSKNLASCPFSTKSRSRRIEKIRRKSVISPSGNKTGSDDTEVPQQKNAAGPSKSSAFSASTKTSIPGWKPKPITGGPKMCLLPCDYSKNEIDPENPFIRSALDVIEIVLPNAGLVIDSEVSKLTELRTDEDRNHKWRAKFSCGRIKGTSTFICIGKFYTAIYDLIHN